MRLFPTAAVLASGALMSACAAMGGATTPAAPPLGKCLAAGQGGLMAARFCGHLPQP